MMTKPSPETRLNRPRPHPSARRPSPSLLPHHHRQRVFDHVIVLDERLCSVKSRSSVDCTV